METLKVAALKEIANIKACFQSSVTYKQRLLFFLKGVGLVLDYTPPRVVGTTYSYIQQKIFRTYTQ